MLAAGPLLAVSLAYLGLLFAVATWADRRARAGRSLLRGPATYALSLAAYCSAWTFYGSVGLAEREGLAFLPVYLGPTLAALLFPFVLRKAVAIAKEQGVTSIADLAAARYGKSASMGGLVTLVAVMAAVPYMALQLEAVAASVGALVPGAGGAGAALLVALVLAAFAILFGTRHVDATERHEGMVVAVALESVVKLAAFLAVGAWATWGLFDGWGDLLARLAAAGGGPALTVGGGGPGYADWFLLTLVSGLAFLLLPRQFHLAVIENVDPDHVRTASWLLPLYLLAINLFVLPLALAGALTAAGDADLHVLRVPLAAGREWLALVAYIGGLSAAAAMVIVEAVALAAMVSNDLLVPVLLRLERRGPRRRADLSGLVVAVRRAAIVALLALAYAFSRLVAGHQDLADTGFIAFAGAAQFAPAVLAGLYWRGASLAGALPGLAAGVAVWAYALVLPALAEAGLLDPAFVASGPFGIGLLRPRALFGLEGLDPVAHAVLWSLAANAALLVLGSLLSPPTALERLQAARFVGAGRGAAGDAGGPPPPWRGEPVPADALRGLLARFVGAERAAAAFADDARRRGRPLPEGAPADAELARLVERQLARAIGAASARVAVAAATRGDGIGPGDLMEILDEASRLLDHSRRLEEKSAALERATAELRAAYDRLRQLDELKDEFVATVSHELRTPLTSIRSFSEILLDTPDLSEAERRDFLAIVVREADRLTRLVNDVLDLAKIESGRMEWRVAEHDLRSVLEDAVAAAHGLAAERGVALAADLGPARAAVRADRDRLVQVAVNLLSNAARFAPESRGRVLVRLLRDGDGGHHLVRVEDDGPGVPESHREAVFERFRQVAPAAGEGATLRAKPKGTGLGLTISRQIVERFGGRIWIEASELGGAAVCFALPDARADG